MNRSIYYDYIEDKLLWLALKIAHRWTLNLLNLNVHSENLYRDFLNILYWYNLENINQIQANAEAIDLIDKEKRILIQVSSTATSQKIKASLSKKSIKKYKDEGYCFRFLPLTTDIWTLKKANIENPNNISFNPIKDIISIDDILKTVLHLNIDEQKNIYNLIKKELWNMQDDVVLQPSNLAEVIAMIWEKDLVESGIEEFKIIKIDNKISFNNLGGVTVQIIEDCKIYSNCINEIYDAYDKNGKNKTLSVLHTIKDIYLRKTKEFEIRKTQDTDLLFFAIHDEMKKYIINSSNYIEIPTDELTFIINIILVDAFIKCKIFKKPN